MPRAGVSNWEKGNPPSNQKVCVSAVGSQPEQSIGRHQQMSQRPEALKLGGEVEKLPEFEDRAAAPSRNPRHVDKTWGQCLSCDNIGPRRIGSCKPKEQVRPLQRKATLEDLLRALG